MQDRTIHHLKTIEPYYTDIEFGNKRFEIRKDDRSPAFKVGDSLCLEQYIDGYPTGEWLVRSVIYILRDAPEFGLMPGYCIMAIK